MKTVADMTLSGAARRCRMGRTPEGCGDSPLSVNLTADSSISSAAEALSGLTWDCVAPEDLFHLLLLCSRGGGARHRAITYPALEAEMFADGLSMGRRWGIAFLVKLCHESSCYMSNKSHPPGLIEETAVIKTVATFFLFTAA